jgi:hypothetical protein
MQNLGQFTSCILCLISLSNFYTLKPACTNVFPSVRPFDLV